MAHHTLQLIWTTPTNYIMNNTIYVVNCDYNKYYENGRHYTVCLCLRKAYSIRISSLAFCDQLFGNLVSKQQKH